MSENKRRLVSLVVLALFITVVGLANSANAGTSGGGISPEEVIIRSAINQVYANTNR